MITEEMEKRLQRQTAEYKDSLISEAVISRIGRRFTVFEIASRASIEKYDGDIEVFSFDGVPLLRFYPMNLRYETDQFGAPSSYTAETPYEVLS